MLIHMFNLLGRAFAAIPRSLGSNWLGILFPIVVVLIGEILAAVIFGKAAVVANWKRVTGVGLAALCFGYVLLFSWCVLSTIYKDHVALNFRIGSLHTAVMSTALHEQISVNAVSQDMSSKLAALAQSCAEMRGANGELTKRAGDQQSTINNCQTQALKLLTPTVFKMIPLVWSDEVENGVDHKETFLILTNQLVTPLNMIVWCDAPLKSGSGVIVGSGAIIGTSEIQQRNALIVNIATPAWTPQTPLRIDIEATTSHTFTCVFQKR